MNTLVKTTLSLALIFALGSAASGALQISVGEDKNPQDLQYTLGPSDNLSLGIWTDAIIEPGVGEGFWALIVSVTDATVSGGVSLITEESGIAVYPGPVPAVTPGLDGIFGTVALATIPSIAADTLIYDSIDFHCEWQPNDVTVTLLHGQAIGAWTAVDSVVIRQIPEPMTMSLLGLGGLLLRRRRK